MNTIEDLYVELMAGIKEKPVINREKHKQYTLKQFNQAIDSMERLRGPEYSDHVEFQLIVNKAIEWYESNNLNAYTLFKEVAGTEPFDFYGDLSGFLVNALLDDSYYELKWKKYYTHLAGWVDGGEAWVDDPCVVWAYDDNPNATQDPKPLLKAMLYLDKKEEERQEQEKRLNAVLKKIQKGAFNV